MITKKEFLQALGKSCLPQRYLLTFMVFISVTLLFVNRTNPRTAIDFMTKIPWASNCNNSTILTYYQEVCPKGALEWDHDSQNRFIYAFCVGFLTGVFPAYFINKKLGAKYCQGLATLLSSLLSILLVPASCHSLTAAVVIRFLQGFVTGPVCASLGDLASEWAPPSERTLLTAIIYSGVEVGSVISVGVVGYTLTVMTWSQVFYISGAAGIVWFIFWVILCYNNPSEHPFISDSELQYLNKAIPEPDRSMPTPWKDILTSKPVWVVIIAEMGLEYAAFITVVDVLDFYCDITTSLTKLRMNIVTCIPYVIMWTVSVVAGYSCDKIIEIKSPKATRTNLRRLLGSVGCVVPGIGMVAASYFNNEDVLFTINAISSVFLACCVCSIRVNPMDLSRNHATAILPLVTIAGAIARMIAPVVINAATESKSRDSWKSAFWTVFAILVICNMPFALYGSGDIQPWDKPKRQKVFQIINTNEPSAPANQSRENISNIIPNNDLSDEASG